MNQKYLLVWNEHETYQLNLHTGIKNKYDKKNSGKEYDRIRIIFHNIKSIIENDVAKTFNFILFKKVG